MFIDLLNEEVRVKGYTDPNFIGLKGRVVSETQKTLLLLLPDGRKARIMKAHAVLEKNGEEILGGQLRGRYWERLMRW
jgi:RNase P/RNase MRP subunit p29